jgi:putative endonuclease
MYYVYLLYSEKLDKIYIGRTEDVKRRLKEHNSGNCNFTNKGIPWKIVYYSAFAHKTDSIREERFLKTGKGRERVHYLLENTLENYRRGGFRPRRISLGLRVVN